MIKTNQLVMFLIIIPEVNEIMPFEYNADD